MARWPWYLLFISWFICSTPTSELRVRLARHLSPAVKYFYWPFQGGDSFVDQFFICFRARLFIDALWSPAGIELTSWLSFVMSNCEVVTFPLVSWVRVWCLIVSIPDLCPLFYFDVERDCCACHTFMLRIIHLILDYYVFILLSNYKV